MRKIKSLLLVLFAVVACASTANAETEAAEAVKLFHESFGTNTSSARSWNDSYKDQSGITDIYKSAVYTITNAKQSKNGGGSSNAGLLQTTKGTDASFLVGPLDLSDCKDVAVSYTWKAASTGGTYSTKIEYKVSASGSFTEIPHAATGATKFVDVKAGVPSDALVSTVYFKITFNTSNTQAAIDEFDLSGKYAAPEISGIAVTKKPTKLTYLVGEDLDLTGGKLTVTYGDSSTKEVDLTDSEVTVTGYNKDEASIQTLTVTYKGKTTTFEVTVKEREKCTITWSVDGIISTDKQDQGTEIKFPSKPANKGELKFMGWTSTETVDATGKGIEWISEGSTVPVVSAVTYYAVYAMTGSLSLTNENIVATGEYSDGYKNYEITDSDGNVWKCNAIKSRHSKDYPNNYYLQIKSDGASHIEIPEISGCNVYSVDMIVSNNNKPMGDGGNTNMLYISKDKTIANAVGSGTGGDFVSIIATEAVSKAYIISGGAVRIWEIDVTLAKGFTTTTTNEVVLTDAGFTATSNEFASEVSYIRDGLDTDHWHGLYLPFDVEEYSTFLSKVVEFSGVTVSDGDVYLDFTEVADGKPLKAKTPYLFKAASDEVLVSSKNVIVYKASDMNSVSYTAEGTVYTLSGTYTEKKDMKTSGAYALAGNVFRPAGDDTKHTLKPFRVYLTMSSAGSGDSKPARVGVRVAGEETTGIENVAADRVTDNVYYNLQGQRVDNPTTGLYIHNGRKVYIQK